MVVVRKDRELCQVQTFNSTSVHRRRPGVCNAVASLSSKRHNHLAGFMCL